MHLRKAHSGDGLAHDVLGYVLRLVRFFAQCLGDQAADIEDALADAGYSTEGDPQ